MADVKALAEELVNLSVKDVQELAKILKEEYGIEPAAAAVVVSADAGAGAAAEAEHSPEAFARMYSEPFGLPITEKGTPAIYRLLARTADTAGASTGTAKRHYMRLRPYVLYGEPTLVPDDEESHRRTGSYPSSHSAMGWATALVLSEVNPDRAEPILQFGYEYGQSRVIAGYHFQSDVDIARLAGAACVARLHTDKTFQKELEQAQKEYKRLAGKK